MNLVYYIDFISSSRRGGYITLSFSSLISSILLLLAASISITSIMDSSIMPLHISHSLQGFPSMGFRQLTALENILAVEVFPVP